MPPSESTMGRPAKPTSLKLIAGNPGKRSLNKQEPDPEYLQDLTPPAWLSASAKLVWEEMAPQANKAKLLTAVDVQAFAMGCVAVAEYRKATAKVDAIGAIKAKQERNEEGQLVEVGEHINPWAGAQSMYFKQAMTMFAQFGMTPRARTGISIQPQGDLFGSAANGAASYFG
jgi:P27 family predicted phage terminase small subunit